MSREVAQQILDWWLDIQHQYDLPEPKFVQTARDLLSKGVQA